MRVPNRFLSDFTNACDLKLACILYSFARTTQRNLLGFEVSASQETLAKLCGVSVSSVRRSIHSLTEKGFILSAKRNSLDCKLGVYTYCIKVYSQSAGYFLLDHRLIKTISGNDFRVYAYFCACKRADRSFWHSYNDLAKMLNLSRSAVISSVARLVKAKHIYRKCRLTRLGDYTENLYTVMIYCPGSFKRRNKRNKKVVPPTQQMNNTTYSDKYIITKSNVCQGFLRKNLMCGKKILIQGGSSVCDSS